MYRPIGKTRIKLAQMLTARLGFRVEPEDFWLQDLEHLKPQWDCASWGTKGYPSVYSWDSMTSCVRRGFDVLEDGKDFEILALPRK